MIIAWDVCDRVPRIAWQMGRDAGVMAFPGEKASDVLVQTVHDLRLQHGTIDKLAVLRGPGSFTGIRIGLATALGMQTALQIPCFGISKFQALARQLAEKSGLIVLHGPRQTLFTCVLQQGQLIGQPQQQELAAVDQSQPCFGDSPLASVQVEVVDVDYAAVCAAMAADLNDTSAYPLEPLYIRSADTTVGKPLIAKLLEGEPG